MLTQYRPPAILSISPNTGPSAGGTRIVLHGVHNLSGGDDYRCRFVVNGTGLDGFGRNTTLQGTGLDIIASGDSGSGSGSGSGEAASGDIALAYVVNATVSGTFSDSDGFVRCITPPVSEADVPLATMVYVTLNGQQYHSSAHALICLLYTSPSPRDGLLSRMPSSA